jgi:hypothetical protein
MKTHLFGANLNHLSPIFRRVAAQLVINVIRFAQDIL